MKLVTWNVNGLRACDQKGFSDWVAAFKPDVLCMQEIKAEPHQLAPALQDPAGYLPTWHPAEKKGYSGVATWTQHPATAQVGTGIAEYDREGRVLFHTFEDFTLVNVYFPNGQRDLGRVPFKLAFYEALLQQLLARRAAGENLVVCGDWNTSHQPIDLANPGPNSKCTGFLPEERAEIDRWLASGFRDVFRERHPGEKGHYTWWSYRPGVREKNIGWRLDYFLVSDGFADRVKDVYHLPQVMGSDHCPVVLELK